MSVNTDLSAMLKTLPDDPGVYIYKDKNGTVIYVGKARNLKNRVRSYFHSHDQNEKTRQLVSRISDLQYIVTANETEALLLENNLIKQYRPKYNILLKDDKGYPYLRLDVRERYPRLEVARRMKFDGALYFGPYHGAGSARALAEIAQELYPLRTCRIDSERINKIRPCLKKDIGRCPGPCAQPCEEAYRKNVEQVIQFLKGNQSEAFDAIYAKMERASERLEFEYAAQLRDKLKRADELLSKQKILLDKDQNLDVIAVLLRDTYAVVTSLYLRGGRLIGVDHEELRDVLCESEAQLLTEFLLRHYSAGAVIPEEILTEIEPEDRDVLEELLCDQARAHVALHTPRRGKKRELCQMAKRNALERMEKSIRSLSYKHERIEKGLEELKRVLKLDEAPHRMECFDISHIQGTDTVASMVVFTRGTPDTKEYRHFKTHQGNNDFASMEEVTRRRYTDAKTGKAGFEKLPDLIVIDGGKGQLHSAYAIVHDELGLDIPMIGLAKKLEEIYLPHSSLPLMLPYAAPSLQILQHLRDESHRFAVTFHRSLRGKHSLVSRLDQIPGMGKTRKRALLRSFGSVSRIQNATAEELLAVPGMNKPAADAVFQAFHLSQTEDKT